MYIPPTYVSFQFLTQRLNARTSPRSLGYCIEMTAFHSMLHLLGMSARLLDSLAVTRKLQLHPCSSEALSASALWSLYLLYSLYVL